MPVDQQPPCVLQAGDVAGGDPVERRLRARDDLGRDRLGRIRPACSSPLLERGRSFTDDLRSVRRSPTRRLAAGLRACRSRDRARATSPRAGRGTASAAASRKNAADTTPVRVLVIESPPRLSPIAGRPPSKRPPRLCARGVICGPTSACQATTGPTAAPASTRPAPYASPKPIGCDWSRWQKPVAHGVPSSAGAGIRGVVRAHVVHWRAVRGVGQPAHERRRAGRRARGGPRGRAPRRRPRSGSTSRCPGASRRRRRWP